MSNFQDAIESPIEMWGEYIERVYQGSVRKFYEDFEKGNIPGSSRAYLRFYTANSHLVYLLSDLLREIKGKR